MSRQAWRQEYEFEKECINQMARSTLREHNATFPGDANMKQTYDVAIKIGSGVTYTKYNTLMHFVSAVEAYWHNPDLNAITVFGKDIRALLATACGQKVFFDQGRTYYHYGPIDAGASGFGFHTNVHSVRSSRSAHALSLSGMKSKPSMKSYNLKHGWSCVAMAYTRFTAGSRLVTQRSIQSACMSVRASRTPWCI